MSNQSSLNLPNELESVEQYEFEPIKGYPMLQWKGKRPFRSTQYYPAQLKEVHGEEVDGWLNKIFWGDNLQVMSHLLKEYRGKVDLVYIDPPFDSKADYKKSIRLKGRNIQNDRTSFEDKQYTDIWVNDEFLQFIYDRLIIIRELLSETGSIYLHCDSNKVHHIRCILEEVFGTHCYKSQIVWKRSTPKGNMSNGYGTAFDTILFFSKSDLLKWNQLYLPHRKEYIEKYYSNIEKDTKRRYQLTSLLSPADNRPNLTYEFKGHYKVWRYSKERMNALDNKGRIVVSKPGAMPREKRYLDEMKGTPVSDLWNDLHPVNSQAKERVDYPTQKPEAILERIIKASSNPGDLIFDCFMGSGTTQAVAMKLGRRFIGADINLGAIQTTTKRLIGVAEELKAEQEKKKGELDFDKTSKDSEGEEGESVIDTYYTGFEVYNVNHYDIFRNPLEARDILMKALEIDPLPGSNLYDGEKDGRMVKIMPVNRIATRADLNPLITGFDMKSFEKKHQKAPGKPVEHLLLVCMGHEPDLAARLKQEVPYKLDVEVVDVLRDQSRLEFKRDSEAEVVVEDSKLKIKAFYPMNLLQKLSLIKENVEDWKELTESVMIDWNYDGSVLEPALVDVPAKDELVKGEYEVPEGAGTIRVKITDVLSESLEVTID